MFSTTSRPSILSISMMGLTLGSIAVLSIFGLTLWSNAQKDEAADWVSHTILVEDRVHNLLATLVDAETGQ